MNTFKHNLWHVLIAIDQLVNVVIGLITNSVSYADETLSSRAYRYHIDGIRSWPMKVIDVIMFWDKNLDEGITSHCHQSYLNERTQRHLPPESRCEHNDTICGQTETKEEDVNVEDNLNEHK